MTNKGMRTGIYARKLLVVNWSLHQMKLYEPFSIDGSVFAGANGSGKSTAFDAFLTVLLGSTRRSNYNQASKSHSADTRNFAEYVVGRRKGSSQKGVREGMDFTTHIVAVFWDSLRASEVTFGMCCDYRSRIGAHALVPNYYFYEGGLPENRLVEDGEALSVRDTKIYLKHLEDQGVISNVHLCESSSEYNKGFLARMGFSDPGYFGALKNLVAIGKDTRIEDFIYRYLCDGRSVTTADDMNSNIDSWQQCREDLDRAIERQSAIGQERERYAAWRASEDERDIFMRARILRQRADLADEIESLHKEEEDIEAERSRLNARIAALEAHADSMDSERQAKWDLVKNDDVQRERGRLAKDIERIDSEVERYEQRFRDDFRMLSENLAVLHEARRSPGFAELSCSDTVQRLTFALEDVIERGMGVLGEGPNAFGYLVDLATEAYQEAQREEFVALDEHREASGRQLEAMRRKKAAEAGEAVRDADADALIAYLRDEAGIEATCLCDAIDIAPGEQGWRAAVEGMLGRKRSDLLVAPDSFARAFRAYGSYRGRKTVRLIDTSGILKHGEKTKRVEGSLAAKTVASEGRFAKVATAYTDWALGDIACCADREGLLAFIRENPGKSAVTANGDCYRGFAVYALAGRDRLRFMIGSSAQEARRIEDIRDAEKVIADNERLAAALSARQELLRSIKTACPDKESRFARGIASMAEDYNKLASGRAEAEGMRAALAASGSAESASIMESVLALKNEIESVRAESAQCQRSLGDADRRAKSAAARREQCEADLAKVEAANVALEEERLEEAACRECAVNSLKDLEERSRAKASASRECWNALVTFRRERSSAVSSEQIDETDRGNEAWDREWCALETSVIPERRALFERMEAETKEGFTTAIVGALRNGIVDVRRTIRETNAYLSECPFCDIRYRFDCSKNIDYAPYYDMIMDPDFDNALGGLWDDEFHAKHGAVIDSFFDTIRDSRCAETEQQRSEALARKRALLDYKSYLSFDMKEVRPDGSEVSLKAGLGGSSGGEQMLPFYVVLFASMAHRCRTKKKGLDGNTLRTVLIDEAFEVVDSERTVQAIELMQRLGLQPILATPNERVGTFASMTGSGFIHRNLGGAFEVSRWYDEQVEAD